MNLQLAESAGLSKGKHKHHRKGKTKPYIFFPSKERGQGHYIREDLLDAMPAQHYKNLLQKLVKHQREVTHGGMSEEEYMSDKASRKQRRQDRHDKKQSKIQLRRDKGKSKVARAKSGFGKKLLTSAADIAKNKLQGAQGGGTPDATPETPWYKTPMGIGGIVVGSIIILGGGYAILKPKGKKK